MIFVGDDWAEDHHDVAVVDEAGKVVARRRLPEGVAGIAVLHELVAGHAEEPGEVVVGIETDRGLWVASLVAGGYQVYAVNPLAVARYRERHVVSGAKSDPGDAATLADLVRTDRHHHRTVAGDSEAAVAVKVVARAHQRLIWDRQRQLNRLRSVLREFYPAALDAFGTDLAHPDALAVLGRAATPSVAAKLSVSAISSTLRRGGRQRNIAARAAEIQAALRGAQMRSPRAVETAYGAQVASAVAVIAEMTRQIAALEDGDGPVTTVRLSELLTSPDRPLVIYHLMYGKAQTSPCPMCTMWNDGINGVAHHLAQSVDFALAAAADVVPLRAHARDRGWTGLRLLSCGDSTFKYDLGSEDADGNQESTVSVFTLGAEGAPRHFYTAHAPMAEDIGERGIDLLAPVWHLLDLTPQGRGDWYAGLDYSR